MTAHDGPKIISQSNAGNTSKAVSSLALNMDWHPIQPAHLSRSSADR